MQSRSMELHIVVIVVLIHTLHLTLCIPMSPNTTSVHGHVPTTNNTESTEKVEHFRLFRRSADEVGATTSTPRQSSIEGSFMGSKSSNVRKGHQVQHPSTRSSLAKKVKGNAFDKYLRKPSTANEKLSRSKRTVLFWKFKKFVKFLFILG